MTLLIVLAIGIALFLLFAAARAGGRRSRGRGYASSDGTVMFADSGSDCAAD